MHDNSSMEIPTIDLQAWLFGDATTQRSIAATVDTAFQKSGFLLLTGHGVSHDIRTTVRSTAHQFFTSPPEIKQQYAITPGGRGWMPPGVHASGLGEGTQTPPDLMESWSVGADTPTGDEAIDAVYFKTNRWPTSEIPQLQPVVEDYLKRMRALRDVS